MFFGGLVNWGNQIWCDDFRVFWATIMIFGSFRSFQNFEPKILKKIQVTFTASTDQTMHFFHDISIFLSRPTCGKLRKIQKSPQKGTFGR